MNEASRKMTIQKNVTGENIVFLEIAINDGPKGLKRGLFSYKNKGKNEDYYLHCDRERGIDHSTRFLRMERRNEKESE